MNLNTLENGNFFQNWEFYSAAEWKLFCKLTKLSINIELTLVYIVAKILLIVSFILYFRYPSVINQREGSPKDEPITFPTITVCMHSQVIQVFSCKKQSILAFKSYAKWTLSTNNRNTGWAWTICIAASVLWIRIVYPKNRIWCKVSLG